MNNYLHPKYTSVLNKIRKEGHPQLNAITICFQFLSASAAMDGACESRLQALGFSEGRFVLLMLLHEETEGLFPHQLAKQAGVTRATITGLLDNLERDQIIERHAYEDDRRKIRIFLTQKGADMATKLFQIHTDWVATLFADISQEEEHMLTNIFERLSRKLQNKAIDETTV
ncbi:MarR family winged helix-turn-helix transcriptional regulator [Desulfovibrio gilichinskyi]|uniref:DNA-binding transcriptional regulator, MarR family n=1 Tax=Desulfovibrio gilichinskyi TaxID=1519643 RepID=A0A1X7DY13_9BACT|nr:MarR family transcriptional regulator [Desulfovibrio gilichinskyi]SMF23732.1 DNA-binding transcriptional regulator, MarR family [Desulfovibrio gilichinskyi]